MHGGCYNLGSALKDMGQAAEAVACLQDAIRLQPGHAESWNNLALVFKNEAEWDKALEYFAEAIRLKNDLAAAYWNRSFVHLLHGRFREGWQDYEWRFRLPQLAVDLPLSSAHAPVERMRRSQPVDPGARRTGPWGHPSVRARPAGGQTALRPRDPGDAPGANPALTGNLAVDEIVARPDDEQTPGLAADRHVPRREPAASLRHDGGHRAG